MAFILVVGAIFLMHVEANGNQLFPAGVDQALGNMEGKEDRLRTGRERPVCRRSPPTPAPAPSIAMHDSLTPIGGLVPLFNIILGEISPGGIGAGLYGMLVIGAILSVFIAGLMVGRTPEYLGKKVESYEMKMAMVTVLVLAVSILGFAAVATATQPARPGR